MEKPYWQDANQLQKWLSARAGCLGMQIPHISVLKKLLSLILLPLLTHISGLGHFMEYGLLVMTSME